MLRAAQYVTNVHIATIFTHFCCQQSRRSQNIVNGINSLKRHIMGRFDAHSTLRKLGLLPKLPKLEVWAPRLDKKKHNNKVVQTQLI